MAKWLRMLLVFSTGVGVGYALHDADKQTRRTLTPFERARIETENEREVRAIRDRAYERVTNGR